MSQIKYSTDAMSRLWASEIPPPAALRITDWKIAWKKPD